LKKLRKTFIHWVRTNSTAIARKLYKVFCQAFFQKSVAAHRTKDQNALNRKALIGSN
jgi:hypothetical protein